MNMLQRDVTRTVGTLAAIFGMAAALFVVAVREREARPSASAPPSEVYARCCSSCHEESELRGALESAPDRAALALEWLEQLAQHGSSSGPEDLALVKWLAGPR